MNYLSLVLLFLVLAVLQASKSNADNTIAKADAQTTATLTKSTSSFEAHGSNEWVIWTERQLKGQSARGQVIVRQKISPDSKNLPHLNLAGSRAWLVLGQKMLMTKDVEGAIACARSGLNELGMNYASPQVADDTQIKLLAAEERIREGYVGDGAKVMLNMLNNRILLYAQLHQQTIVK